MSHLLQGDWVTTPNTARLNKPLAFFLGGGGGGLNLGKTSNFNYFQTKSRGAAIEMKGLDEYIPMVNALYVVAEKNCFSIYYVFVFVCVCV